MNEAIKLAIKGGYNSDFNTTTPDIFFDINFWIGLVTALPLDHHCEDCIKSRATEYAHKHFDLYIVGENTEKFWSELLDRKEEE